MKIVYGVAIGIILLLVLLYFFRLPAREQALIISRVELTPKNSFYSTTFISTATTVTLTFNITTDTCIPQTYYNVYLNGQQVKSNVECPFTNVLSLTTSITLSSNQTADLEVSGEGITSGGLGFVNYQYEILYKQKVNGTTQPQSISTWMTVSYFADYMGITTDSCSVSVNILSSSPVQSGNGLTALCFIDLGITSASLLYGRGITLSYVAYNDPNKVPQNVNAVVKVSQYNTNQYIGQTTITLPTEYLSPYNATVSNAYCYSLSNLPKEELSLDIQVNYTVNNYPYNFQITGLYFNNTHTQPPPSNYNCQQLVLG